MEQTIIIFIIIQFFNIVLSTFKTVFLVKSTKEVAAFINAIAYTVGILVIKFVSDIPLIWSAPLTFVLNLLGVFVGLTIIEKTRKNRLWRISTTLRRENLSEYLKALKSNSIQHITYQTSDDTYTVVDVFSKSKMETKLIKPLFVKYNVKYTILTSEIDVF